jgi:hypothetical protein
MARLNTRTTPIHTHEGAAAKRITAEQQLRRSVMACMLWEKQFYESGDSIAQRILDVVPQVSPVIVSALAVEARTTGNLRHAPLLLASALAYHVRGSAVVADTIAQVVQRADELAELVAIHCEVNGVGADKAKTVLSAQMKKGLARAFQEFDGYQLAKYNRDGAVRLRDVLFLCHAKPKDAEQAETWKRLIDGTLPAADTWEVALSSGEDKRQAFERLLREGNLGYMALLRNLRNMVAAGVDLDLVRDAILARKNGAHRVLPFRYIAAARAAPQLEPVLDQALLASLGDMPQFGGTTALLVDVSGSMMTSLSERSDLSRMDAAAALAALWPGQARLFTFSRQIVEVPPRRGMAGVDAVIRSQLHGSTDLGGAVQALNRDVNYDRLVVITDEQSATRVPDPLCEKAYMVNVASYQNGVGYGRWTHIDGFSESVLKWMHAFEADAGDSWLD